MGLNVGGTTLGSDGVITCNKLIANTSGSIGGWTITSSGLVNGNFAISIAGGMTIGATTVASANQGMISLNTGRFNNLYIANSTLENYIKSIAAEHNTYTINASGTDAQGRPVSVSGSVTI